VIYWPLANALSFKLEEEAKTEKMPHLFSRFKPKALAKGQKIA